MTVHQMGVMATLTTLHKMIKSGKPKYIVNKMKMTKSRHSSMTVVRQTSCRLKMTAEGFLEQGAKLWNLVPNSLKTEQNLRLFKKRARQWVNENCPPKPIKAGAQA